MSEPTGTMSGPAPFRRLVSFGTVVVDVVAYVDELPPRGADLLARRGLIDAGGARNVLAAAARQGLSTAYAGLTGAGPMGDVARAALATDGIEVLQPPYPGCDTGVCLALVEPDGERTFVTIPGAEGRLDRAAVRGISLGAKDAVHVSGYTLQHAPNRDAVLDLLGSLDAGITLFYDPGPLGHELDAEARGRVARRCTWWSGNAAEARAATGRGDAASAADSLAASMPGAGIVVRDGARGCLVVFPGESVVLVPGFAAHAVDTSGAGDTHLGAFIAAIGRGLGPLDAARRANAAAALAVGRTGPAAAPTARELDEFLGSNARQGAIDD